METNNDAGEGRPAATCSPSSLTPETDEAWKAVSRTPDGMYDSSVPISAFAYAMSNHSKKMELERNEARKAAEHYRNLYYLPKDGLAAAKNHPLSWENAERIDQHPKQS